MDEPFLIFLLVVFYGLTAAFVGGWIKGRLLKREMREQMRELARAQQHAERPPAVVSGTSIETSARLGRMEEAVESLVGEIERLTEGQRFTTKLLDRMARDRKPAAMT